MQISSNYSMNGVPYENRRSAGCKRCMDGSSEGSKCEWSGNKEKRNVEPYITDDDTKAE